MLWSHRVLLVRRIARDFADLLLAIGLLLSEFSVLVLFRAHLVNLGKRR